MTDDIKNSIEPDNAPPYSTFITPAVFAAILLVYLVTLLNLYPAVPVILAGAEEYPHYVEAYPPFRMDEVNYYKMAKSLLAGDLYDADDSVEMSYPAGFSVVAAPFVAVWDEMGGYIANMLIIWCSLIIFYLIARRHVSRVRSLIMTVILAFATTNWFYAVSCYTEPLAQLLVLLGFWLLTWDSSSRRLPFILVCAGLLTGLNLFVRPHYILLAIPFFLCFWVEREKKIVFHHTMFWYAGGVSAAVALWFIRNGIFFGGMLNFEYSRLMGSFVSDLSGQYRGGNLPWGIHELLFDKYHGLLTITPVFMLFPAGLINMWKSGKKRETYALLGAVVLMTVFIARGPYPFTGFGLGSRHMVPIIPLILLPAVYFMDGARFSRIMVTLLAGYSFYVAGLGWFTGDGAYVGRYGMFPGLLNQGNSRAIILMRKGMLPDKTFSSNEEILQAFDEARVKNDIKGFFQTLHPEVLENIKGYEIYFMRYMRQHPEFQKLIVSVDHEEGIKFRHFNFTEPN